MANVGFREIQGLLDKLSEASFKAEEKVRTHEGALEQSEATLPEHLFAAWRGMFPMPSKPGFLLQDAWDAVAVWTWAVGEVGLTEGLSRLGRCAYNRWRLLRATGAGPGIQAEPLVRALKGPREEEGPHHQARRQERRNNRRLHRATRDAFAADEWGITVQRVVRRWLTGFVGSQKARSSPGSNELRADMVLDSAPEESRQHCNQGYRTARSVAGREAISNNGTRCVNFRPASGSYGKRAANTKAIEGIRKRRCHHKSAEPRSVPSGLGS
ncbi:hypothetical protein TRVL_10248 [Trypanosoma vivax]|nr:hypothetical protein TRVL_10248 [Trypanosoma vivax]